MIFYLHIPKTGGLTLGWRFALAFLPGETHTLQNGLHFPKDLETFRSLVQAKQFVESHIGGPMLSEFTDLELMVTVRDPVEQILSYWRNIQRDPKHLLHRAANKLHYRAFFDAFGDRFADNQTRYFTGAFVYIGREIQRVGHYVALPQRLLELIGRVRWLVPTESIDEFVKLWSLETKRWLPNATRRINVAQGAPEDKVENLEAVREYLRNRSDLYTVDLLFHQIVRESFAAYRTSVIRLQGVDRYADNSRRAFISGESAIWLSDNWYDPVAIDGGHAWWAGPSVKSVVHVRRAGPEKYLTFDVIVISGIAYESIEVLDKNMSRILPTQRTYCDSRCKFCISLDSIDREDDVVVLVPDCKASIMTTAHSDGLERQSFAAANWSLDNDPTV
jgi:hypothetical protein